MKIKLGKLKQLGMTELSDLALYMPTEFSDYRFPITNFDVTRLLSGCEYLFRCQLASDPSTKFTKGRPQTSFTVTDGSLLLQFTLFGDVRDLIAAIKEKQYFYVNGTLNTNGSGFYINNAEVIDDNSIGTVCALYPGIAGKLKAATVRKLISEKIDVAIPLAVERLHTLLYKRFQSSKALRGFLQCHQIVKLHPNLPP